MLESTKLVPRPVLRVSMALAAEIMEEEEESEFP